MLTIEQRPLTFADMAGQDIVRKSLLHICKDPANAPKTLLLCGPFGSGKTTAARIFARALNCLHPLPNGDACGVCSQCKSNIQESMFYSEYDAAMVGNVDSIKSLRDTFYFGYTKGYKVIVLDEVHLVSKTAQGALLKVFEEPEPNVFFLLCTTDPEKLLPTIVSRSFTLQYSTVNREDMINHLHKIIDRSEKKLELPPEVIEKNLNLIFDRSHGHMRNAMMLLDSMFLLQEDFQETVRDSKDSFLTLIRMSNMFNEYALRINPKTGQPVGPAVVQQNIINTIHTLTTFPISNLKQDFEKLVLEITKHTFYSTEDPKIAELVQPYLGKYELLNILNDLTIYQMFTNETMFQIAMHTLSNKLKQLKRG